ncbi:helix-turn-helix domain-containing protein [Aliarcobacter skirrowii]|uniref:helix-turn-helix domain-containing protein n=1 Tax=Aliarcobacter skirrowii TaxID=28200 RepID=UPI0029A9C559|nr:helix-turn-helix domain-containing protein [Aliarcobacter skirrowii]MDX4047701.1 helix-turn-helix domain-containing protein [Aliarcobacter skirrowii]
MSEEILTIEDLKSAIKRIKRRRGIESNADISITMIAKEVGCSRQTLYKRKDFDLILDSFKKIKINSKIETVNTGTKEYYRNLSREREEEIIILKGVIQKLKNKLIDYHVLEKNIEILNKNNERLKDGAFNANRFENENKVLIKKINSLMEDNEMLRKKLMNFNRG